jgi:predicted amidohydrolase
MRDIRVATAQFEHADGDKAYNLERIARLTARAADEGAEAVCFHECAITGYTFLQNLSTQQLHDLSESLDNSSSLQQLTELARRHQVTLMAGLIERDAGRLFNTYLVVTANGLLARHRKLHPFIHPGLSSGEGYTVFDWAGVRWGVLICYDNNLPENVRATTLLGAEVIVMPHVTGCLPSSMPGRGTVDPALWHNRHHDPVRLKQEFRGPKGLGWLLKWLPARAWENGIYAIFANPIGQDGGTIKPGLSMVIDPHGEILTECHALDDDVAIGLLTQATYQSASGRRYLAARRPELYAPLTAPHPEGKRSVTLPGWR